MAQQSGDGSSGSQRGGAGKGSQSGGQTAGKGTQRGGAGKGTQRGTRSGGGARRETERTDKSVEAFRDALERSVTLSGEKIQEVVDDAVKRGRMTRKDANDIANRLISRGRQYTDDLLADLERMIEQARQGVESHTTRATKAAGGAVRAAGDQAGRLRRGGRGGRKAERPGRAGAGAAAKESGGQRFPIANYDQLNADEVRKRLANLGPTQLRAVRERERRGKARKTVLEAIDKRL